MNIGMIYQGGEFPPAERIEKEARSLTQNGHTIYLLCNNYGKFKSHYEKVGEVNVTRILPTFKSYSLNKALKFPVFLNPLWFFQILSFAKRNKIDVFHVIDIPLALAVIIVGKLLGIKIVFDMWEPYPESLKEWSQSNWKNLIFKNYAIATIVEYISLRFVDKIITVVDEKRDQLLESGIDGQIISVVTNAVDIENFQVTKTNPIHSTVPIIMYVGAINKPRGLVDIVNACKLSLNNGIKFRCVIVGDGDEKESLMQLSKNNGTDDIISFPGWINFEEVPNYIATSYLCVIPHMKTPAIEATIPNKLFQYMYLSKCVLVSDAKPLKRIVDECECGYVYKSGDAISASQMINVALSNPKANIQMGLNGHNSVINKYNWRLESEKLINLYKFVSK